MESITLRNETNFITLTLNKVVGFPGKTCYLGGYDSEVRIEIKCGGFHVKSDFWASTGQFYTFNQELKKCNTELIGHAKLRAGEGFNLELLLEYDGQGHIKISGVFSENGMYCNELKFAFQTDQTFIFQTLKELALIVEKYGDMKGLKK